MADELNPIIKFPFGDADVVDLTATGAQALTIENLMTIIDGQTVEGTGDRTLNLTIDPELMAGAQILVIAKTDAAEHTIFGTGFANAPDIIGNAGATYSRVFIYDGTNFQTAGVSEQAAEVLELTATGAQALTISGNKTIIDGVTTSGTADRTLNLTIGAGVQPGARLLVKYKVTGGTFHLIYGAAIDGPDVVGVDGKTKTQAFTFDGTTFLPDGASVQID
jgi:hypothetical protein